MPAPIGPISPGLGNIWQDLRRRSLEQAVTVEAHGIPADGGRTVIVANHAGELDAEVLRRVWPRAVATIGRRWALRRGAPVLLFPEGGTSPDGTLGAFQPEAFDDVVAACADGRGPTLTPVAIIGTHGVDRQLPWGRSPADRARIVIRAGAPIDAAGLTAAEMASRTRDAVAALLAEDRGTWYEAARDGSSGAGGAPGWREAWRQRSGMTRPGEPPMRRIWGRRDGDPDAGTPKAS